VLTDSLLTRKQNDRISRIICFPDAVLVDSPIIEMIIKTICWFYLNYFFSHANNIVQVFSNLCPQNIDTMCWSQHEVWGGKNNNKKHLNRIQSPLSSFMAVLP
jgi:hypothetical protein